jgi:UDP-N-acetyl-D-mannosaminuronic acid dehydrogenase
MEKICIIGLGYIGLPTASMLANNGYQILGVDINDNVVEKLNSGRLHIEEPDLEATFLRAFKNKKIRVSKNVEESDIFIITVPTPLTSDRRAELKYVSDASMEVARHIKKKNLVILESTSPPGTTEGLVGDIIFKNTNLLAGRDYYLAFCPERVLPGKIIYELVNNKRIIGGIDRSSAEKAKEVYSRFVKSDILLTDLKTAEFVKLVENTYRDVNLAFSNELSLICGDYGINIWEVIRFANMHPRVNILNPGPGVGGHCIPVDPWFLIQNINREDTLIEKCRNINDNMPVVVAERIVSLLKGIGKPKVSLFGAAYKENIGDTRESPALAVIRELEKRNIDFSIYDPLAENFKYPISSLDDCIEDSDMIVLLVGHDIYKNIDFKKLSKLIRNKMIFDTRNFFNPEDVIKYGFKYFRL